ncbi:predicted permease [Serpentinimonas raichei]|uniref:Predicted permease n=1 Tax=Serpentinimonas raichei TaxID=1458425 RepID=A0A060NKX1_9BURK|nr:AI-2E family transporter [Serpentinimonas raichei]BAO81995.1 predicted permease [Serpentinimonas raichei]
MNEAHPPLWLRRALIAALLSVLLLAGLVVLQPFVTAVVWAAILVYVSWPLYQRLLARFHGRRGWAAFTMTMALAVVLVAVPAWLLFMLQREGYGAMRDAVALLRAGVELPEPLAAIPWLGPWLEERLALLGGDREALGRQLAAMGEQWGQWLGAHAVSLLGDLGLNAMRFAIALLTAFFLFRDGEELIAQSRQVLQSLLGARVRGYFDAVGDTTRAVVYGLLLAAIVQGFMAGLGYWAAGISAPVFWGAATAMLALIPFGATLIWVPMGLWLLLTGHIAAGVGLLLWGMLAVSWIDNLVRPLVISGVSNVPFLIVLFGVLGGLGAFGLIGLFVGPVILAVLLAIWREWAASEAAAVRAAEATEATGAAGTALPSAHTPAAPATGSPHA